TFELVAREAIVGRHPSCDVVLTDSTVSRRHARVRREGEQFYLDDLGSQHGAFVNGQRITGPKRLVDGDRIQISKGELSFLADVKKDAEAWPPLEDAGEDTSRIVTSQEVIAGVGSSPDVNTHAKLRALLDIIHNVGVSL